MRTNPTKQPPTPTAEQAYAIGAKGAEPSENERLLFEAWMRGHCWAVTGTWDGKTYIADNERGTGGWPDPQAMRTRQLWAAWRDRAALSAQAPTIAEAPNVDHTDTSATSLAYTP